MFFFVANKMTKVYVHTALTSNSQAIISTNYYPFTDAYLHRYVLHSAPMKVLINAYRINECVNY